MFLLDYFKLSWLYAVMDSKYKFISRHLGPLSFYKKALFIALPIMGQLLIQNMVSLIDNFMVAGLGDIKMSGVNISGQINFIFLVLINTICLSGGIFMSQYNGAHNEKGMQQALRFKLIVGLTMGCLYTAICIIFPRPLLSLMVHGNTASEAIIAEGIRYMQFLSPSWIPAVIATSIGSSLREIGKVKTPLLISVAATIINTVFNWLLIYGNLGFPRLETMGAAIATVIARTAEMVIFIVYLVRYKPPFYFRITHFFKVNWTLFQSITKKSGFLLVSEMTWVVSETVTTALYNSRGGAEVVSGMAAGFALANLFFICFNGIGTVTGVILGGAVFLIPLVFGNLSPMARQVAAGLVLVNACYMPAWAYINGLFAVARTGGDTTMGAIIDFFVNLFIVIPGMFALTFLTAMGPVMMYCVIKTTDAIKITIAVYWIKKERWLKNLTVQYEQT